jgi:hypothetical protein
MGGKKMPGETKASRTDNLFEQPQRVSPPLLGSFTEVEHNMETIEITTRSDFALWAIERAQEIVRAEGSALALAARDMDEAGIKECGTA